MTRGWEREFHNEELLDSAGVGPKISVHKNNFQKVAMNY